MKNVNLPEKFKTDYSELDFFTQKQKEFKEEQKRFRRGKQRTFSEKQRKEILESLRKTAGENK